MRIYASRHQKIFIDSLTIDAFVGVNAHEYTQSQPLVISLTLDVNPDTTGGPEAFVPANGSTDATEVLAEIICYEALSIRINALVKKHHIGFVETLAEQIIHLCFQDMRIEGITVRIEKPDAISDAKAVGIEVHAVRR